MGTIDVIDSFVYGDENPFEKAKRKMHQKESETALLKRIIKEHDINIKERDFLEEAEFLFSELNKQTNFLNIAEQFLKKQPLFYDKHKIWWIWNRLKFKWEIIDETDVLNSLDKVIKNPTTNATIKCELLEALRRKSRLSEPKQPPFSWVQFGSKVYDIETDEHFEASCEYFIKNPIPWKIGETEETPIIDKLFIEWVGAEKSIELYEILAFCIVPCYFIHRLFCEIGAGANGKSTFLNLLVRFVGIENVTSSSLYLLLNQRFEGSKLLGKLVCLMGETNFTLINNTDFLKKLTGEDLVRAEFKGKDCFDFKNYAKLIMATNSLPPTTDKVEGFYRRWKINEWENKFKKEKDVLKEIPDFEYENLALKCLNIAKRLWRERVFTNEGDFETRKKVYEDKSNPLKSFINENFERSLKYNTLFSDFFEGLLTYLDERGHRTLSAIAVSKQLKNEGFDIKVMTFQSTNAKFIIGLAPKNGKNDEKNEEKRGKNDEKNEEKRGKNDEKNEKITEKIFKF